MHILSVVGSVETREKRPKLKIKFKFAAKKRVSASKTFVDAFNSLGIALMDKFKYF